MKVRLPLLASLLALSLAVPVTVDAALRTVVGEEFTGTWCGWCPSAMEGLYNLEQQVGDRLAVVAYHVSDVFQVAGCVDRKNYYTVTGYPTVMFDGIVRVLGGDVQPVNYVPYYNQREGVASPATLDLTLLAYDGATGDGMSRSPMSPGVPTFRPACGAWRRAMIRRTTGRGSIISTSPRSTSSPRLRARR
jgi:thiol-disulfide isomerase/thioredoxin